MIVPPLSTAERRVAMAASWRFDPAQMMRDAGFDPDPHQIDLLESQARNNLVMFPRQAGKSQTLGAIVTHGASFDPGDIVILAGEKKGQANEVAMKALRMHERLLESGDLPAVEPVGDELQYGNGSRVLALPSRVQSIRGYAAKTVIVDEAAFTGDDTLAKVSPMLTTTEGRLFCSSTPNGASGWFYAAWHDKENEWSPGNPDGWRKWTVSVDQMLAYERPRLTLRELKRQQMILTPIQYRQEYLLEWLDGDQQFFPTEVIEAAFNPRIVPLFKRSAVAA